MCGIVGAISTTNVSQFLFEGLKRLEYRGYDSAGFAILDAEQKLKRNRQVGKVKELVKSYEENPVDGVLGLAHTRWATHGKPSQENAHPHFSAETFALVHNGIIENYVTVKEKLKQAGYSFSSETDTEVIVHLIHWHYQKEKNFLSAIKKTVAELEGAYAIAVICQEEPLHLIVARMGAPLVIGPSKKGHFIASDLLALLPVTDEFIYLEDGDIADCYIDHVVIYDSNNVKVSREIHHLDIKQDIADKGEFRHYMLKEIMEQPKVIENMVHRSIYQETLLDNLFDKKGFALLRQTKNVRIVACGTSYHAGLVARYWLEDIAGVSCQVEVASEIRYRKTVVTDNTLFVAISQSGETADTLAALKQAKTLNYLGTLAICNVAESALVREADFHLMTEAGVEIGVASTKAFTSQLVALLLLTLQLTHDKIRAEELCQNLTKLSSIFQTTLNLSPQIEILAKAFSDKSHALFLGRGLQYPIALEGALKLKEISYIHAEAYPAGELKHGPLALVDKEMPVVVVMPNDNWFEKLKSNLQEVRARGGELFVFADEDTPLPEEEGIHILRLPKVHPILAPIVYSIPLQLLAYHVAVLKGTDIDQPRNLAKSVTVE